MVINEDDISKIKIALSLKKLLLRNKKEFIEGGTEEDIVRSYNNIAVDAELRKATVSDIFNAKSQPKLRTVLLIVEAMKYSFTDFAKEYESVSTKDIDAFLSDK